MIGMGDAGRQAHAAGKAIGRALSRRSTYPGAVRELFLAGVNVALYPAGLMSEALDTEAQAAPRGRFSNQTPLCYLDPEAATTPIVLLHGYFHNRSAFVVMRRSLRRFGFRMTDTLNYNVIGHSIDELAEQLAEHVDEVKEATGSHRVHIIGHSLGGLVARLYNQEYGGDRSVHTCITLGTPHHGTYAAYAGRGRAAAQLRPGSELFERLAAGAKESPVRYVSYYSNLDAAVIPAASAKLTEPALRARNVLVKDHGHLSLLLSRPLIREIAETLANPDAAFEPDGVVTPFRAARAGGPGGPGGACGDTVLPG